MAAVTFNCPYCGQSLEASSDMSGPLLDCPSCKKPLEVPFSNKPIERIAHPSPRITTPSRLPPPKRSTHPNTFPSGNIPPINKKNKAPIVISIILVIAAILGASVFYLVYTTKHSYLLQLEQLLSDANRLSIATGRGVSRNEFVDSYKSIDFKWGRLDYARGHSFSAFGSIRLSISRAVYAWEAADSLWALQKAGREDYYQNKDEILKAIVLFSFAIGDEQKDKLEKASESDGHWLYDFDNLDDLISLCFAVASSHISDAELAVRELR